MKKTINSWIIRDDEQTRQSIRYRNKGGRLKHDKARFNVCLCSRCNRVYERNVFTKDSTKTYYYRDFPTYKLERIICSDCNGHT